MRVMHVHIYYINNCIGPCSMLHQIHLEQKPAKQNPSLPGDSHKSFNIIFSIDDKPHLCIKPHNRPKRQLINIIFCDQTVPYAIASCIFCLYNMRIFVTSHRVDVRRFCCFVFYLFVKPCKQMCYLQ